MALAGSALVARAAPWDEYPFREWSDKVVDKLLTDSPWAHGLTVSFEFQPARDELRSDLLQIGLPPTSPLPRVPGIGWPGGQRRDRFPSPGGPSPGGYPSVRTEAYLTVRWSSALPVRQALALEQWGRRGLETKAAVEFLEREQTEYIIEIFGLPGVLAKNGTKRMEEGLAKSATLRVKGLEPIKPTSAYVPGYGEHLSAELRFPRPESIDGDMGQIELEAQTGPVEIQTKFKLKDMVYQGRLEL